MNKNLLLLGVTSLLLIHCQSPKQEKVLEIMLTNNSSVELTDKAIAIQRSALSDIPEGTMYPIVTNHEGDTLPSQLDDLDGDGVWDELFFTISLPGAGSEHVHLSWSSEFITYPARTSVRFGKRDSKEASVYALTSDTIYADEIHAVLGYQPYQTDGPTWENDKVGFRHYFDGRNAKDLFGKKTSEISPETVGISSEGGVEDNYHVMEDWGRDILSVGNSAGLGGVELLIGEEIPRLGCVSGDTVTNIDHGIFNIVVEGPERSIMDFTYNGWKPLDREYQLKENVRIWPGMYAFENNVSVNGLQGDEQLIVGIVNRDTDEPVTELELNDQYIALYTHDMQSYESEWWLGMGLILPKDAYQGYGEAPEGGMFSTSYYGKLAINEDEPVTYYAVGCWELSDPQFADSVYFVNYLQKLGDQLAAEVAVEIH